MNETIYYKNGHTCIPNGVGDYTFVCPDHGKREGFIPFMFRELVNGTCKCGQAIELDEQPKIANAKGKISPCPKCDSPEVHVEMIERKRKRKGEWPVFQYLRKVSCLSCGNSTAPVLGIPPYVMSDDERRELELAWRNTVNE